MNDYQKDSSYTSIYAHLKDPTIYAKPERIKLKGCRVSKSLLMKGNQLWVPDNEDLWLRVIKKIYDQPVVGHPGRKQTSNIVQRHYYWPCIHNTIEQYIQNCHIYKKAKTARDIYNGLLQLLPVLKRLWINVTINFVTGLPKCHAYGQIYDIILIIIDWLLKKRYYILYSKDNESTSAKATAKLFM